MKSILFLLIILISGSCSPPQLSKPAAIATPSPAIKPSAPSPSPGPAAIPRVQYRLNISIKPADWGSVISSPEGPSFEKGTKVLLKATPAPGYLFMGWSGDMGGKASTLIVNMDANKNIIANFHIEEFRLKVLSRPANSGSITISPQAPSYKLGTEVNLRAYPAEGYLFSSWTGDLSDSSPEASLVMDSNKNIIANFMLEKLSLIYKINPEGSGRLILRPLKPSYNREERVLIEARPAPGYKFVSWSGDISGKEPSFTITMDSNKGITASFEPVLYDLIIEVQPSGAGRVDIDTPGPSYKAGTVVTLKANTQGRYKFSSWAGDAIDSAVSIKVKMDRNKKITANFVRLYKLSVYVYPPGAGWVSMSPSGPDYAESTTVRLRAYSNSGYIFRYWSEALKSPNREITITMDSDKILNVNFEPR